jgi:Lectin C-type domain
LTVFPPRHYLARAVRGRKQTQIHRPMKSLKSLLAVAAAASTSLVAQASVYVVGGPIYNPATDHTYYLLSPDSWTNSEAFAQTLGGHLVTINDAAENAWVYDNLNVGNANRNAWIGLNDVREAGTWEWISGEPVTYLDWAPEEPNFAFEHWVHYYGDPAPPVPSQWNNLYWDNQLYGIAEVPEPSVLSLVLLGGIGGVLARCRRQGNRSAR